MIKRYILLLACGIAFAGGYAWGQASPYRGLWVGTVTLDAVNEVSIPLDSQNVPRASDPLLPTPTFDTAQLRVLVHVNGAGQAFLLKDVAILNREEDAVSSIVAQAGARESDLALVTDPRMYAEFPPQPAVRIASAAFDFGDSRATEALDVMVAQAADRARDFAAVSTLQVGTEAQRLTARNAAMAEIQPVLTDMASAADVAARFTAFVDAFPALLSSIVDGTADIATLEDDAETIRDGSFFGDSRALDMLRDVVAAVEAAAPGEEIAAARNTAAAYADVQNEYQRFIAGQLFGNLIVEGAATASDFAPTADNAAAIDAEMRTGSAVQDAITRSLQIKLHPFEETRGEDAVDTVLLAMAETAFAERSRSRVAIARLVEEAGRAVLSDLVARYALPTNAPTLDYTDFVRSDAFQGAPGVIAEAAARAAIDERATNPLYTELSLHTAARLAAIAALRSEYLLAARAQRTELPLEGEFAPGAGDPRRIINLAQPTDLGDPGLTGRIYLPASHPTNPFRHRRHPDHTEGFNIERKIRFDFDGNTGDPLQPTRQGVDRVTGTYREEVFGLHKPLGPDPATDPIGLRTEGRFELNRISYLDTLNTR